MKKLLLIRHAKAVHDNVYDDFDRPLKHSGEKDAETISHRLKKEGIIPQMLVSSPSLRTQKTAAIISEHLSLGKATEYQRIYEASRLNLLSVINEFPDNCQFVGLVGHNPGISQVLYYFTGEERDVTPGSAALIEFPFDKWALLSRDTGDLKWFGSPKED